MSALILLIGSFAILFGGLAQVMTHFRRRENKVLKHLPRDKRKEARIPLRTLGAIFWGDHKDIEAELTRLKAEFLETYGPHADVEPFTEALRYYIQDAWYDRAKAAGGPIYSGVHSIR